jgi:hypothetical protein
VLSLVMDLHVIILFWSALESITGWWITVKFQVVFNNLKFNKSTVSSWLTPIYFRPFSFNTSWNFTLFLINAVIIFDSMPLADYALGCYREYKKHMEYNKAERQRTNCQLPQSPCAHCLYYRDILGMFICFDVTVSIWVWNLNLYPLVQPQWNEKVKVNRCETQ